MGRRVVVVLLVVTVAAAIFLWPGYGERPIVDLASDVSKCAANLRQIYGGFVVHYSRTKELPKEAGVRFLASLVASGALEDTPAYRERLTCPGPGAEPVRKDVHYKELATLTGADSAYAGRDAVNFPLAKFPSGGSELEPLAACDNARGMNHDGCMNVLYSDGSVVTFSLADEIQRGRLPADAKTIPVGKDSPIPDLRKLSQD